MTAGEYLDICCQERRRQPRPVRRIVQRVRVEPPTGQRLGIAMHHSDPQLAHPISGKHWQFAQTGQHLGMTPGGRLELGVNPVGTLHYPGIDRARIGAAATSLFSFDQ